MATNPTAKSSVAPLAAEQKEKVRRQIDLIKSGMPETYRAIQDKAEVAGALVWPMVRRGMAGQPNCFYALERRQFVGTPFAQCDITDMVAGNMVRFGVDSFVIFGDVREVSSGTH